MALAKSRLILDVLIMELMEGVFTVTLGTNLTVLPQNALQLVRLLKTAPTIQRKEYANIVRQDTMLLKVNVC